MTNQAIPQVLGFCFARRESQIVMIRKNRPDWQAGKLNVPGGHVERNETPRAAVQREFAEETGVSTDPEAWKEFGCYMSNHGTQLFLFGMVVKRKNLCPAVSTTDEPIEWTSFRRLTDDIIPNLRFLIPMAWFNLNHHTISMKLQEGPPL